MGLHAPPVPEPSGLKQAHDNRKEVGQRGQPEEGRGGPCQINRHSVLFERHLVGVCRLVVPPRTDSIDFDFVRIMFVLAHVLREIGRPDSKNHHESVGGEANQVENPDPLRRGQSPSTAQEELAITDLVYDRGRRDPVLPAMSIGEAGKVAPSVYDRVGGAFADF